MFCSSTDSLSSIAYAHVRLQRLCGPPTPHHLCSLLQAVPANLTRYGLSQIINHLLNLGEHLALRR